MTARKGVSRYGQIMLVLCLLSGIAAASSQAQQAQTTATAVEQGRIFTECRESRT